MTTIIYIGRSFFIPKLHDSGFEIIYTGIFLDKLIEWGSVENKSNVICLPCFFFFFSSFFPDLAERGGDSFTFEAIFCIEMWVFLTENCRLMFCCCCCLRRGHKNLTERYCWTPQKRTYDKKIRHILQMLFFYKV